MPKYTFIGLDKDLAASLLELGMIMSNEPHEDGSGSHFFVYRMGYGDNYKPYFGCGHIYPNDIKNILLGKDWASNKDLGNFFEYLGICENKVNQNIYINEESLLQQVYDLSNYFGKENIFGTEYSEMSYQEVKERYLNQ